MKRIWQGSGAGYEFMRNIGGVVRFIAVAALLAAVAVVSSCRQAEQGRILHYQKGTYLGEADQNSSEGKEQELRARARHQSF